MLREKAIRIGFFDVPESASPRFFEDGGSTSIVTRTLHARITGGIVPCPAALVVLLSAFSLHRVAFGLFLITAFSLGLAAVLVIVGLTMVYAKRAMSSRLRTGGAVLQYLPFLSSACMVLLGAGITASAVASVHLGQSLFSTGKLLPFVTVILLGLFLGCVTPLTPIMWWQCLQS